MLTSLRKRNSNLEILRIISMIMIFFHHSVLHGGTSFYGTGDIQDLIREMFFHGGKLGVVIFVLISAYFQCSKKLSIRRLVNLVIEVVIINVIFFGLHMIKSPEPINLALIRRVFLPFTHSAYWFLTVYLLLQLASPLLNIIISNIKKNMHLTIIIVLGIIVSYIPVFLRQTPNLSELLIFIFLYFIASYFKVYPIKDLKGFKYALPFIAGGIYILFNYLVVRFNKDGGAKGMINLLFYNDYSPLCILIAILLLLFFIQLKPHHSAVINFLALGILEVYLIHENVYVRPVLYQYWINSRTLPYSDWWSLQFFGIGMLKFTIILLIGIAFKFIYSYTVKKLVDFSFNKLSTQLEKEIV